MSKAPPNLIDQKLRIQGKSQGWLARKTGIGRAYINRVARRKIEPKISTAHKIAKGLGVPIEEIWFFE